MVLFFETPCFLKEIGQLIDEHFFSLNPSVAQLRLLSKLKKPLVVSLFVLLVHMEVFLEIQRNVSKALVVVKGLRDLLLHHFQFAVELLFLGLLVMRLFSMKLETLDVVVDDLEGLGHLLDLRVEAVQFVFEEGNLVFLFRRYILEGLSSLHLEEEVFVFLRVSVGVHFVYISGDSILSLLDNGFNRFRLLGPIASVLVGQDFGRAHFFEEIGEFDVLDGVGGELVHFPLSQRIGGFFP